MDHVGIYLTNGSNKTIELPVTPAELMVKGEVDGDTATVLGLGEIKRYTTRKLIPLSIESTLPLTSDAHWVTAQNPLPDAQSYIDWLTAARDADKPVRFVLSGTQINVLTKIDGFEYGFKSGNSVEYHFALPLTEWREYKAERMTVKTAPSGQKTAAKKGAARAAPAKKLGIGSKVVVNGQLFRDSYGGGPGMKEHNVQLKITLVAPGRARPYHVATLGGVPQGWVSASSLKGV